MSASVLYLARSLALVAADDSIQIFPPGTHVVTPSRADGEEPEELELVIDAQTAELLEDHRAAYAAAAERNEGDAPYFDFNHEDREASAWPKKIYWAGDDPITGGVRAKVEWSAAGEEAVSGKLFRRFSPAFFAEDGRITGAPVNMGGLVNRAAFGRIAPLFKARPAGPSPLPSNEDTTMTEDEITALKAENDNLQNRIKDLESQLANFAKKDAEAAVEMAAKEGRIPATPEVRAKWVDSIVKDASAKDLLLAMAPNPALKTTITTAKQDPAVTESPAVLLAKYESITDATERRAFFAKHSTALKAARDASIGG
jgi:hypothetical protein